MLMSWTLVSCMDVILLHERYDDVKKSFYIRQFMLTALIIIVNIIMTIKWMFKK